MRFTGNTAAENETCVCATCKAPLADDERARWVAGACGAKGFWMHERSSDCIPGLVLKIHEARLNRRADIVMGFVCGLLVTAAVMEVLG